MAIVVSTFIDRSSYGWEISPLKAAVSRSHLTIGIRDRKMPELYQNLIICEKIRIESDDGANFYKHLPQFLL